MSRLAWLIENGKPQGHGLKYLQFVPVDGVFGWTENIDEALQFSRRKDAECVGQECEEARTVEHSFAAAHPYAAVHEEFVKVVQGVSTLYRFGSDRVRNGEDYIRKHAQAMCDFSSPEIHPESVQMYRNIARRAMSGKLCASNLKRSLLYSSPESKPMGASGA